MQEPIAHFKEISEIGFTLVFAVAALYGVALLGKYFMKLLEQKEQQIRDEREARDKLTYQTLEVVRNNTDGFREMVTKLTDFMQEGRTHHKEVITHLSNISSANSFSQKPLRRVK
jgi:hypothetical protein